MTTPPPNGAFLIHATASSIDFTCHSQKPATSSFDSVKGPSVTVGVPPENFTRLPLDVGCRPSPASMTPAFTSSSLNLPMSVRSFVSGSTPASDSLLAGTSTITRIVYVLLLTRRTRHGQIDTRHVSLKELMTMRSAVYIVCSVFVTIGLFVARPVYAQTPPPPAVPPAQVTGGPLAPVVAIVGEEYRVEFSAGAWITRPSTVEYSDTETLTNTVGSTTTTTVVNGTLVNFRSLLGLSNQTFPEGHLTVRIAPKQKIRGEYIPLQYKQTVASLSSDFNFNGETYKAGQTVESTYHWNEWKVAYEFDALTFDRGFVGGQVAMSAMNISAAMANTAQS